LNPLTWTWRNEHTVSTLVLRLPVQIRSTKHKLIRTSIYKEYLLYRYKCIVLYWYSVFHTLCETSLSYCQHQCQRVTSPSLAKLLSHPCGGHHANTAPPRLQLSLGLVLGTFVSPVSHTVHRTPYTVLRIRVSPTFIHSLFMGEPCITYVRAGASIAEPHNSA
jgi:hypothetical protein